jgi:hypothetical protein
MRARRQRSGVPAVYILIACYRIRSPFEIEWFEGTLVDHVQRILNGESLYVAPSLKFVPCMYTPLYYFVAAVVAKLTGIGFSRSDLFPSLPRSDVLQRSFDCQATCRKLVSVFHRRRIVCRDVPHRRRLVRRCANRFAVPVLLSRSGSAVELRAFAAPLHPRRMLYLSLDFNETNGADDVCAIDRLLLFASRRCFLFCWARSFWLSVAVV